MEWIKTSDQLPTSEKPGLIAVLGVFDIDCIDLVSYDPKRDQFIWGNGTNSYFIEDVTHWMPLPELPAELG